MSITAAHGGDLSRAAPPTPAARRQRRHRARRKQGGLVAPVTLRTQTSGSNPAAGGCGCEVRTAREFTRS